MSLQDHPRPEVLERFLRGEASRRERQSVVAHLLEGCPDCLEATRTVWVLADLPWDQIARAARRIRPRPNRRQSGSTCHYGGMRDVQ